MVEDDSQVKAREKLTSNGVLEQKTEADLVKIYNATRPYRKIKKLESIAQGVRMILERLVYLERKSPCERPSGGRPPKLLDIPPNRHYTGSRNINRKRWRMMLELIKWGVTIENLRKVLNYNVRYDVIKVLKLMNKNQGYGFKEEEMDGKLRIL